MTSYVWNGGTGNFETPGNWSPSGVPGPGDAGDIPSGVAEITDAGLSGGQAALTIQLGGVSSAGTLVSDPLSGETTFTNVVVASEADEGYDSVVSVTGEIDFVGGGLRSGVGSSLVVTLAPKSAGASGFLVIADASSGALADGSLSIVPDTASDVTRTALVNDGTVTTSGGTTTIDVPVYAETGQTGLFTDVLTPSTNQPSTLEFASSVADQIVDISPGNSLILDQPGTFQGELSAPIYGLAGTTQEQPSTLQQGVTVDLRGVAASSVDFVTDIQTATQGIELANAGGVVGTLALAPETSGALGVSLGLDSGGGTSLKVDLSSDGTPSYQDLDTDTLVLPGAHGQFVVTESTGSGIVTGPGINDFITPRATLIFSDGIELFNAATTTGAVDRLYEGLLGRVADYSGLSYWSNLLESSSLSVVADDFLISQEFASRPTLSNMGFVDQLYTDTLGRQSDASGQLIGPACWIQVRAGPPSQQGSAARTKRLPIMRVNLRPDCS